MKRCSLLFPFAVLIGWLLLCNLCIHTYVCYVVCGVPIHILLSIFSFYPWSFQPYPYSYFKHSSLFPLLLHSIILRANFPSHTIAFDKLHTYILYTYHVITYTIIKLSAYKRDSLIYYKVNYFVFLLYSRKSLFDQVERKKVFRKSKEETYII